jgi:AcrR family transcriptional regulator
LNPEKKYIARKQELFAQITEIITEEGYANITIRGICQKLGISTGSFYHYFPEKGDLAWVLFSDIDDYFTNTVVQKFEDDECKNLVTYCTEYGNYILKNGVETCRFISVAQLNNLNHNYIKESRGIFKVLLEILGRGAEKGQFQLAGSPLETTRMIMVILRGYCADWAKQEGNYDLIVALRTFIQLFCKGIVN